MSRTRNFVGSVLSLAMVAGTLLCFADSASAATATFTGTGANLNWSNTANWSSSYQPGNGDNITFNSASGAKTPTDDLATPTNIGLVTFGTNLWDVKYNSGSISGVTINNGGGFYNMGSSWINTWELPTAIASGGTATITMNSTSGTLTMTGALTGSGNLNVVYGGNGSNSAALTLTGANNFGGTINIWTGALTLSANGATSLGPAVNIGSASGGTTTGGATLYTNYDNQFGTSGNTVVTLAGSGTQAPAWYVDGTTQTIGGLASNNVGTGGTLVEISTVTTENTNSALIIKPAALQTYTYIGTLRDRPSGTGTGKLSLAIDGPGEQVVSVGASYTGATTITGGELLVNAGLGAHVTGGAVLASTNAPVLNGGTFAYESESYASAYNDAQGLGGVTLNAGASSIQGINGDTHLGFSATCTLNLAAITRNAGSTVNFIRPTTGTITSTTRNASFSGGTNTILGGYATVSGTTWAVTTATPGSTNIAITPYAGYTASFTAGKDVDVTGPQSPTSMTINSLRFNGRRSAPSLRPASTSPPAASSKPAP